MTEKRSLQQPIRKLARVSKEQKTPPPQFQIYFVHPSVVAKLNQISQ